jgi:hypothetical protein
MHVAAELLPCTLFDAAHDGADIVRYVLQATIMDLVILQLQMCCF